jgi:hypothetical protein
MQKIWVVVIFICLVFTHARDLQGPLGDDYHGDAWQKQTAPVKLQKLWNVVTKDTRPGRWPSIIEQAQLFIESMPASFDTVADDMPKSFLGARKKLIHSVGVIAQAKFVSYPTHNYTGLFKGGNFGLIRLSSAAEKELVPSCVIKFFRNNVKSSNIFFLYNLEAQESKNFFRHDLTNHPPDIYYNASAALLTLRKLFSKASDWPTFIGLNDFAKTDENGNVEKNPKFPFRLIFHPPANVRALFPETGDHYLIDQLKTLEPMTLFDIYAEEQPYGKANKIGRLDITTKTTTSIFSDNTLFFQHERFDDDLLLRPQWKSDSIKIDDEQRNNPHYIFPDLPDSL